MAGIHVVAFLVGCAPNLMACDQISTSGLKWTEMPACQAELRGLVRSHSEKRFSVIMAKCHYVMDGSGGQQWHVAGRAVTGYAGF